MESVVDDAFPADADAALLWELLGALPTDDQNQADAHSSVKLVRSSEDPQLPDIGGEEAEVLREDVGLLEALCTPLVAFDDGFLADDLDVHEVLRLEDRGDKMPVVEESASSTGTPSDDQPPSRARRKRTATKQGPKRYNSNKAREEQRRELLSLRSQVTEMEKAIEVMRVAAARGQSTLQTLVSRRDKLALAQLAQPSSGRDTCERHVELTNVWRQMCLQQLTRRIKAQQENAMLKDAVARRAQVTTGIQILLQTPLDPNGAADVTTHKRSRVPKIPSVDPEVEREIFARLSSGVDAAFGDIDAFLEDKGLLNVDTPRHGTQVREAGGGIVLDVFVTSVLPFDWEVASSGVWQFYKGFKRHFGPVHDKMTQRIDAGEDTVMESFIIEITANNVTADFRVRQVMKRFVQEQQLMLVCQNDCQPIEYMNQTTNFGFRETSFVICRPPRAPQEADKARNPVSILQLGQWISPYMVTTRKASQQVSLHANIDDISQFLFSSLHVEMRAKINRIEDLLMDEHRND